ncbi:MAG: PDZ domain-containing protein, partial [Acidobacteria bacterium]|nr:PDZ domain-containing protein [Acidobacteriota bacterium]
NLKGEAVGINTAITRSDAMGRVVEGIGFAIPINLVKDEMEQLKTSGKVSRGYLGVQVGPVDADAKEYLKSKFDLVLKGGALVQKVDEKTPASRAGIQKGDIIVSVDGKEIKESKDLVKIISRYAPKKKVNIELYRDGKKKSVEVVLGDRNQGLKNGEDEEQGTEEDKQAKLGITVEEISPKIRMYNRIPDDVSGVYVRNVDPKSNAFSKGLRQGEIISEINGETVESVSDFKRAVSKVKSGDMVSLYVQDGSGNGRYIYFKAE